MVRLYVGSTKAGGWDWLIKVTWGPFPTISCKNLISADLSASRDSILMFPLLVTLRIQVTKCTSYRMGVSTEALPALTQIFVTMAILHLQSIMSCRQWGKSVPDLHLAINNAVSIFFQSSDAGYRNEPQKVSNLKKLSCKRDKQLRQLSQAVHYH